MIECVCGKCGNKWLLHNPNATCDECPYCGHGQVSKRECGPAASSLGAPRAAAADGKPAGPRSCPKCGRPMGAEAVSCIYCGTSPTPAKAHSGNTTTVVAAAVPANVRPPIKTFAGPGRPAAMPVPVATARPSLETLPVSPSMAAGGGSGGLFKLLLGLLVVGGAVAAVWYFTRWHPNFTLAIEPRRGEGTGTPITFRYKLKDKDLIRTSAHMDLKMRAKAGEHVEDVDVSLDYKQFTRVVEVLASGDYLTRTTTRFVDGRASGGFDVNAASRALANMVLEAEIDSYGWVRPGTLADLGAADSTGTYDSGGIIVRSLPRVPMAPGQVVDVLKVVPLPERPIQGVAQFAKGQRPGLTGDCLFKGIEVRNGRKLAHLSLQALMVWEGEQQCDPKMEFKAGVLWKGSCFYDIEAGLVTEVYLNGKIEVFAHAAGQGDMSIVGTIDYYDFSDLNPVGE